MISDTFVDLSKDEYVALLKKDVAAFNEFREQRKQSKGLSEGRFDLSNIETELEGAYLFGANLENADLNNTSLKGANLNCAMLYGAKFDGTDLENAVMHSATIGDTTELGNAKNFTSEQLYSLRYAGTPREYSSDLVKMIRGGKIPESALVQEYKSEGDYGLSRVMHRNNVVPVVSPTTVIDSAMAVYGTEKDVSPPNPGAA